MQGIHFTVIGAVLVIALAYWGLKYSQGVFTVATGGTTAVGNIPRAWTKGTGAP